MKIKPHELSIRAMTQMLEKFNAASGAEVILSSPGLVLNERGAQELNERLQSMTPQDREKLINAASFPAPAPKPTKGLNRSKLGHLMHLAADNDERGLDALIALAVHNNRYPKEKS